MASFTTSIHESRSLQFRYEFPDLSRHIRVIPVANIDSIIVSRILASNGSCRNALLAQVDTRNPTYGKTVMLFGAGA